MLRRLAGRHHGPLPFEALARMWSEMIAAFTQIQADYSVAVFVDDENASMWDLARDQFGAQTPIHAYGSTREVLEQVFDGSAGVGVLPLPTDENPNPWWTHLCVEDAPQVISRLPFAGVGNVRGEPMGALAIARLPQEPTGRDRTLLAIETTEPMSRDGLSEVLDRAKINPHFTVSVRQNATMHLVELTDFVTKEDSRFELLEARDAVLRTHIIGYYAEILGPDDFSPSK